MVHYPNNIDKSLCQNINSYTPPDLDDVPELATAKSSSISGSTEDISHASNSTSLNTTKLEEEPNPFEQSFETSQKNETNALVIQHLNSVSSKPVTYIKGSYHEISSNMKRKRTSDLKDEEKRKNFLERNRIAALKCRQRKKQWLQNLQTRVEYLAADNEQYHMETNALREELVNLKMLLLAHKGCPMDQQAIHNALNQTVPSQMMSHIQPI
ncbi:hypothetical protein K501DRAFT_220451 [Backusella circina FSU 941]|nr:hypothetical protein K501DRAFT_220451 [Backusella circina FSU 941]